jgi:hypothetical protein
MFLGVERRQCVRLTSPPSVSQLSRQCRILDISQLHIPPWPVTGMAILLHLFLLIFNFEITACLIYMEMLNIFK